MSLETVTIHSTNKHNVSFPSLKIPLHGFDLFGAPIQILNHRFFHPPPSSSTTTNSNFFSKLVEKLKSSLAEALELYPPVQGTIRNDDEYVICIAMDDANRPGTPFTVEIKDTPYIIGYDSEDLSPRTGLILPPGAPTLAVKVTLFSCGTIVVASSLHHQVADLRGFLDFLEVWAQLARDEPIDLTRIPKDWSRTPARFFDRLNHDNPIITPPPFTVLPEPPTGPYAYLLAPSKVTRWKFTKASMSQLKADFSSSVTNKNDDTWISSGDALASLISGAITRARHQGNVERMEGRSALESQQEKIAMAADGRERAPRKNMAKGHYFGNFNNLWSIDISRDDLLSPTPEAGGHIALAIRKELNIQLSPQNIGNRIAFFEDSKINKPPGRIAWSADIILTNWCRNDLQGSEFDLGWGKPFKATSGANTIFPPGYSLMTQDKESGEITVLITVENAGDAGLKSDLLLTQYAELL
ncbi:hypothetical protein INT45_006033 [Circinella minor]|uniref:Transferase n=1 Tax=Circinella minor TaxID=1195481 RepID=A0A8H7RSR7_9FUNG|nr:hypothetical protein INT45_006033 [Circinella minor]